MAILLSVIPILLLVTLIVLLMSLIVIREDQVGIVIRKFGDSLKPGKLVALNNEAGFQADMLAPGWHFGYWPWQFKVRREPVIVVPQGQIALVLAADGRPTPAERILGRVVPCDHYQDARKFLENGGEKGRQMSVLTAGVYRINTALFTIITSKNAAQNGMYPDQMAVYSVESDQVGIVMTLDGIPIDEGEIAGPVIPSHDNYQNGQQFLDNGGRRGLQEQVLLSGSWNLNPWFVHVEQVPMTQIPIGHVGIVISYVGRPHEDVSGAGFKHGNLVEPGHKGVWVEPLYPGKHPINSRVMKVELVPTTNIVLNWASRTESHNLDAHLSPITVRSKDGFAFNLDVSQIIHIGAPDAPKVISRVGAVQNLVDHVLQPIVGNYFRNAAQSYTVLDFLSDRSQRQHEAAQHIQEAINAYDVQAIDTLIGDIKPPEELMLTQTQRKIAEEQRKTYEIQQLAQEQRQSLVRETALADIQEQMVGAEQGVTISQLHARAEVERAKGEAEAIMATGDAKAKAYGAGVNALGAQHYTALQLMQVIGDHSVRIVPDVSVTGQNGGSLTEGLLGTLLRSQVQHDAELVKPIKSNNSK